MIKEGLYRKFAKYYDLVYSHKDYKKESDFIDKIIKRYKISGKSLLDVACGTGNHAKLLTKKGYKILGLDKNKEILQIARKKVTRVRFKQRDMISFKLAKKFDILICMFTAINYNLSKKYLLKTLRNFKAHIKDKGIIIFDSPLHRKPVNHASFLNKNLVVLYTDIDIKKIREVSIYFISKKKNKVEVIKDIHKIRIYSLNEFSNAIKKTGLKHKVYWDFSISKKKGKRPIIICRK